VKNSQGPARTPAARIGAPAPVAAVLGIGSKAMTSGMRLPGLPVLDARTLAQSSERVKFQFW
jgi:hypothetical protein